MGLQTAITNIKTQIAAITGIKGASDYLPDSLPNTDNWVVLYPGNSTFEVNAGMMKELGSIVVELHTPRRADLASAIKRVMPYWEAIPNCIIDEVMDTQLTAAVSTIGVITCSGIISMKYNDIDTVGIRYTVTGVKIESSIT